MSILFLTSPAEMALHLAQQVKHKRLSLNLSQQTLAERSGVSYGVLKKFERTGQISIHSLLKLALILDALEEFKGLFALKKPEEALTLDELIKNKPRKRGRK